MKLHLCTLFDSNYLDKALVLRDSLERCCEDYILYFLPMDKKCTEVLKDLSLPNVEVLNYNEFEDEDLKRVKNERTRAEFCWTCTAKLVKYVIARYNVPLCTYIDADLCFYENPEVLIQEMIDAKASVQVIRHNFRKFERAESEKSAGKFCVEFNTFLNNEKGIEVLNSWESDCVNECSYGKNDEVMGDQKYLEKWPYNYDYINITQNQGAGVAPWNVNKFFFSKTVQGHYVLKDEESKNQYKLVFYHFQNIRFIDRREIECCVVNKKIRAVVSDIYTEYLREIICKKEMLYQKYGIDSMLKIHPADKEKSEIIVEKNKGKGIKRLFHILQSAYLIMRANVLHCIYCRNEENLIIKME